MAPRITINDLALMVKQGFNTQGKQLTELKTDVGVLKTDVGVLKTDVGVLKTDVGILKTDVGILKTDVGILETDIVKIKDENYKNGDALAGFINRFEAESAATVLRFDRIEDRLDRANIRA